MPGAEIYPAGLESRDAYVALQTEPRGETTPIVILAESTAHRSTRPTRAPADLAARLAAIAGIDRVEGAYSITDTSTGEPMSAEAIAQLYATPRDQLPAEVAPRWTSLRGSTSGSTVRMDAISLIDASQPDASDIIPVIRALDGADGIDIRGGWHGRAGP